MFCFSCGQQLPANARYCSSCGIQALSGTKLVTQQRLPRRRFGWFFGGVLCGIGLLAFAIANNRKPDDADFAARLARAEQRDREIALRPKEPEPVLVPVKEFVEINSGQMNVDPSASRMIEFTVQQEQLRDATLVGRFQAYGGSRNDIEAVVAEYSDALNWANGHGANALYGSPGKTTAADIEVPIRKPGRYAIVFSNRFSPFTGKTVQAAMRLYYTVMKVPTSGLESANRAQWEQWRRNPFQ